MQVKAIKSLVPTTTLRDVFFVLFRQKKKCAAFFFVVVAAVTLATLLAPPVYESGAKILFRIGRESLNLDPTLTQDVAPMISVGQTRDAEIQSNMEILKSKGLAEEVVAHFGPAAFLDPNPESYAKELASLPEADRNKATELAVKTFLEDLKVEISDKSNIISVSLEAYSPELAHNALKWLLDAYRDKYISVHHESGALAFFLDQKKRYLGLLTKDQDKLNRLKTEAKIGTVRDEQYLIMTRINALKQDAVGAENQLSGARARAVSLEEQLKAQPETVMEQQTSGIQDTAVAQMQQQLFELRIQEQRLLSKYLENAEPVQSIRQEISEAEAQLKSKKTTLTTRTRGINPVRQQILSAYLNEIADIASLAAKKTVLDEQLAQAQQELVSLLDKEVEIDRLEREIKVEQANYLKYTDKAEQSRITDALDKERLSNLSVVQKPTIPIKSIRPKKLLNIALGVFLAFFGSLGYAFALEYVDQTFKRPEDVESTLELPVLVSLPLLHGAGGGKGSKENLEKLLDSVRGGSTPAAENPLILRKIVGQWETPPRVRFAFRELRDKIYASNLTVRRSSCLMVTSCHPGEGVSSVTADLAKVMAAGDERVLLVDANFHQPCLHKLFEVDNKRGLLGMLLDLNEPLDGVVPTGIERLDFLPAGNAEEAGSRLTEAKLLDPGNWKRIQDAWKERYQSVIIDTEPVGKSSTALRFSGMVDGALWVIEAENIRKQLAMHVSETMSQAGANILGCVFNKRKMYLPRWLYSRL